MPDQPSPRRRFQFSLRTLFVLVTLLAILCGYVGWQVKIVSERKAMIEEIRRHGAAITAGQAAFDDSRFPRTVDATIPWVRERLGDEAIQYIRLPVDASAETKERARAAFPEAEFK